MAGQGGEQPGLAQPPRKRGRLSQRRGRLQFVQPAAVVHEQQLSGVVGAEAGDLERRVGQLAVKLIW